MATCTISTMGRRPCGLSLPCSCSIMSRQACTLLFVLLFKQAEQYVRMRMVLSRKVLVFQFVLVEAGRQPILCSVVAMASVQSNIGSNLVPDLCCITDPVAACCRSSDWRDSVGHQELLEYRAQCALLDLHDSIEPCDQSVVT
jgi:hypothetical protein